jgi:hypothetical protein
MTQCLIAKPFAAFQIKLSISLKEREKIKGISIRNGEI